MDGWKPMTYIMVIFSIFLSGLHGGGSTDLKDIKKLQSASAASPAERTYLGQSRPGMKPERFDPGIFPEGKGVLNPIFSPDGSTFYFTVELIPGRSYQVYKSKWINGQWSKPAADPVMDKMKGGEPSFSPDGQYLFFRSSLDENGKKQTHADIWRIPIGKVNPEKVPGMVNSPSNEAFPVLSSDGNLFYHSNRPEGFGATDLYTSLFSGNAFGTPVNLGDTVNSKFPEFHPCISPDGSYLIFSSLNRPDGVGSIDLYISFKMKDGAWSKAVNLGKEINSESADYMPFVSNDRKYLFFTSTRKVKDNISTASPFGKPAIYWVDVKIIDQLKNK